MMQTERDLEARLRRDATAVRREALPDAGFHHRIMARVTSTTVSPVSVRRSFRLPGQLALAASFVVVALALGFVFSRLSTLRPAYRNDGAPALVGTMMAADPARRQVVLFGGGADMGRSTSETWTWDGSSWSRRHPSSSPPPRSYASMTYDAVRQEVVIFGGITSGKGPSAPCCLNDTWVWNGTTWKEAHSTVVPPATNGAAMAYDPSLGLTVLLDGGFTWTWDGTEWSKGPPAPPKVASGGMAFDPANGSLVLVAFSQATKQPQTGQSPPIATWRFDGRAWTEQAGVDIPTPTDTRTAWWPTLLAEDPLSGSLMGVDGLGRTWSRDGSRWTVLNVKKVTPRSEAVITYDPTRHLVLLFGGLAGAGPVFAGDVRAVSDLSVWDGKQWTVLPGGEQAKTFPTPGAPQESGLTLSLGVRGSGADWVVRRISRSNGPANGLYQSVDGGRAWQKRLEFDGIYDGMSWSQGGNGVMWSIDWAPHGCSGPSNSCAPPSQSLTVYMTTDGGNHWIARAPTSWPASVVYFRGLEGWATSGGPPSNGAGRTLYHSGDAGASWAALGPAPGALMSHGFGVGDHPLEFISSQRGWFATLLAGRPGDSGLSLTTDGGRTWLPQPVQPPPGVAQSDMILGSPEFLNDGKILLPAFVLSRLTDPATLPPGAVSGYAISRSFVYSTFDGGIIWTNPQQLQAPNGMSPTNQFTDFFLDSFNWWITAIGQPSAGEPVPQYSVARTTDGGKSWQVFKSPIIVQLRFTDAARGWASAVTADNTNVLLRTTDGGAHWQRVQVP